jgi:hypothetical protein
MPNIPDDDPDVPLYLSRWPFREPPPMPPTDEPA